MNRGERAKSFVALAAPSGGGKTTLCQMLLKRFAKSCLSISYTTRQARPGEVDGRDYYFVDSAKFQSLIEQNLLVEWALVHGNHYGTGKDFLLKQKADGRIVLLDIDVQGVASLKKIYPTETLSIFIQPPSIAELEARLRARKTESEEKLRERLENAKKEIACAKSFDYQVVNQDLNDTFNQICAIIERETGLI